MAETPDFDALAEQLRFQLWGLDQSDLETEARIHRSIVKHLRQVWNARGAADIVKLQYLDGAPAEMMMSAIRNLDR